ncbi:dicarboxylate/amino acid:cation symporter, partial [Senegalimassilia anaerobia]|uniref:dicarboxylate/amino acid:cation symporter n=1 Tax=Senegalimassilia anaerobia TaxID=1473216 RepID=UPI0026F2FEE8
MSKINDLEQEVKADVKEATEAVSAGNADKPWFKRLSLTTWIFIALALGVVAGLALQGTPDIATTYIKPLGTIFLNLIKMIVVPLVIFSMIAGIISLSDIKKVGAIGGKTIAYYLCTTACAIVIGLIIANVFNVGGGYTLTADELSYEAKAAPSFIETIVNIFPSNFVQPMSDASMLQIIVIALFFGFGILAAGKKAQPVADFVNGMSEVCIKIMHMIISIAPFGVFGLIAPVVATNGPDILLPLLKLILVAYLAMILHMVLVYSGMVKAIAKMGPLTFFKGQLRAMTFAFASASSVGTLPINMECSEKLGVRREVSSFVLPLGATINMD